MNNSVIIASTASFLVDTLSEKLEELNLKVFVACNETELYSTINATFPRLIFIEHCFRGFNTDDYVYKTMKYNQNLHIVIWTACEINPFIAARFIHAGAESFISLRDSIENIERTLFRINQGKRCYPKDVGLAPIRYTKLSCYVA